MLPYALILAINLSHFKLKIRKLLQEKAMSVHYVSLNEKPPPLIRNRDGGV